MPGALDLVAALPPGRFAYVTSANARLAAARLTAAGLTFDPPLVTADDVVRGKPDPEPYLLGASRLGIDPANCVVFEDAPSGIASARTAGMGVIGITSTHAAGELAADVVVASPATVTVRGTGPILIGVRR
jgi:sugar-phosphatase